MFSLEDDGELDFLDIGGHMLVIDIQALEISEDLTSLFHFTMCD